MPIYHSFKSFIQLFSIWLALRNTYAPDLLCVNIITTRIFIMRKLIYTLSTAFFVSAFSGSAFATMEKASVKQETLSAEQQAQLNKIEQRVQEIKSMDKSNLTRAERKELKKELRQMNQQTREMLGGGVYLSVGAIIIIILVLIILL